MVTKFNYFYNQDLIQLNSKTRYPLPKVASITILFYFLLLVLQFVGVSLTASRQEAMDKMFSSGSFKSGLLVYSFMTLYFHFFVNRFYAVIVQKKTFLKAYLPWILLSILAYSCYQAGALYFKPEAAKALEGMRKG